MMWAGPAVLGVCLSALLACNETTVHVGDGPAGSSAHDDPVNGESGREPTGEHPDDAPSTLTTTGTTEATSTSTLSSGGDSTTTDETLGTSSGAVSSGGDSTTGTSGTTETSESSGSMSTGTTGSEVQYDAIRVAASEVSCVLRAGGQVRCWGWPFNGGLGYGMPPPDIIGDDEDPWTAGDVPLGGTVAQIDGGHTHSCAVLTDGTVRCWGGNNSGCLGYGSTEKVGVLNTPEDVGSVELGAPALAVAGGYSTTCALLATKKVRCWGQGGLLGNQVTENIGDDEFPSAGAEVGLSGNATAIAVGNWHACAILAGDSVQCWGDGTLGALGYANTEVIGDDEFPSAVGLVDVGGPVEAIAAGGDFTCALLKSHKVRCWGVELDGRLGHGDLKRIGDDEAPSAAAEVDVGGDVTAIALGDSHACAILAGGNVRCWGDGEYGQLGYGNEEDIGDDEHPASAGNVELGGEAVAIAVGIGHTCAVLSTGAVRCWGRGTTGQLGLGNKANIGDDETPVAVDPVKFL